MVSPLRLGGLATGMDTDEIIRRMMALEKRTILLQEQKQHKAEARLALWREVDSKLTSLLSTVSALKLSSTFHAKQATSGDDKIFTASAAADATAGTYRIEVQWLARQHRVRTNSLVSPTNKLSDTLTFSDGKVQVGKQADGTVAEVNVVQSDTLHSLRDKINSTSATVQAEVVKYGDNDYRLLLKSKDTGEKYSMGGSETGNVADAGTLGGGYSDILQQLGILNADGTFAAANVLDGPGTLDAELVVDGVPVTRSANTIDDLITGVTLTLNGQSTAGTATNLTIAHNSDAAVKAVESFVKAYNDVYAFIKEQTQAGSDEKEPGLLLGDSRARGMLTRLRSLLFNQVPGLSGDLDSVAQVGLTTGKWGSADQDKLLFDSAKLTQELAENPDYVAELFGAIQVNVALNSGGAIATAGSTDAGSYSAADLTNGNTSVSDFGAPGGGWKAGTPGDLSDDWVEIDFGADKTIDQVKLFTTITDGVRDVTLYYWKDGAWAELDSATNNTSSTLVMDFAAVSTRKIKIEVGATNHADSTQAVAQLIEVEVLQENTGVGSRTHNLLQALTLPRGTIDGITDNTLKEIDRIKKHVLQMETRLDLREQHFRSRFEALELAMSRMNTQSQWLQAQLAAFR